MGVLDREWSRKDEAPPSSGLRRSSSGRVPQWALEEALNQQLGAYQSKGSRRTKRPRRRRSPRSSTFRLRFGTAALFALVIALYLSPTIFERGIFPAVQPHLPWSNVPPPGVEAAEAPLGMPPPSTGSGQFELFTYPGLNQDVVAYDPCRPVHYTVRPDFAPPGTEGIVQEAVAAVSAATGLTFVFDGATSEAPSPEERDPYQPERYGERWAPILITWTSPAEVPDLAGPTAGLGGSEIAQRPGKPIVLVAGQAMLDAPAMTEILQFEGGRDHVRAIVIHELAHVLGLDHVDDPTQLMYAENSGRTTLAEGDLAGLATLGAGSCVPEL